MTGSTAFVEELSPAPDPADCCERFEGLEYRLFLDSAAPSARLGRYSFVTADPVAVVTSRGTDVEVHDRVTGERVRHGGDALAALRALLAPHAAVPIAGLPPFQGGAAGYIAYDWGRVLERLPDPRYDDLALLDVVFGIYDWVLAWDHAASKAWLISTGIPERADADRRAQAEARAAFVRRLLSGGRAPGAGHDASRVDEDGPVQRHVAPSYPVEEGWCDPRLALRSSFTRDAYLDAVERVREYIFAGDIFQTNLSQRFDAPLYEPPWQLYLRLRDRNAAPFAAFLELPEPSAGRVSHPSTFAHGAPSKVEGRSRPAIAVLSASPERFLHVDGEGHVETRPIKGTRPRGFGPEHDAALGQALTESAKDRAENLMIVDLMRNDLSRVCSPGTVRVPELFALERYATVHHLVSTVVGELEAGADALDLVRAAFPGGSITGAPKVRAMEIIAELEPSRRGVYCGSIGYWSVSGELDTSIAIRTAVARGGRVYFNAGGGIVADSSPEQEYLETLHKARGIIDALAVPL